MTRLNSLSSSLKLACLVLLALLLLTAAGGADEDPAAGSPDPATADADEAASDDLETFVPSEKLPADSAISFPVDI